MKLEDIYAAAAVAESFKKSAEETAADKTELDNVSQRLKDHLSNRKLQMEACQKIRQKSAEDKAKAASDLAEGPRRAGQSGTSVHRCSDEAAGSKWCFGFASGGNRQGGDQAGRLHKGCSPCRS